MPRMTTKEMEERLEQVIKRTQNYFQTHDPQVPILGPDIKSITGVEGNVATEYLRSDTGNFVVAPIHVLCGLSRTHARGNYILRKIVQEVAQEKYKPKYPIDWDTVAVYFAGLRHSENRIFLDRDSIELKRAVKLRWESYKRETDSIIELLNIPT